VAGRGRGDATLFWAIPVSSPPCQDLHAPCSRDFPPPHITQRGNRRENVFFTEEDREVYLEWPGEYCRRHEVAILAYCLMTNHIHLVAVPGREDSLQRALKPLHMRYAQHINRQRAAAGAGEEVFDGGLDSVWCRPTRR
jgi:REP element-mobilizing transposase RayT